MVGDSQTDTANTDCASVRSAGLETSLTLGCNAACPACCRDVHDLVAQTESRLRIGALWLSSVLAVLFISAQIFFAATGRPELHTPDILWAIVMAPWGGAAVSKIAALLNERRQ